jgi:hypothetical protein
LSLPARIQFIFARRPEIEISQQRKLSPDIHHRRLRPMTTRVPPIAAHFSHRKIVCALALALAAHANAQVTDSTSTDTSAGRIYTPADFAVFVPRNAMDMLDRVPGFVVRGGDQGRGLGQANTNVLINGQRPSSKSQDVSDLLSRITADNVVQIEIVDGSTLQLPGLSGQVANVITRYGDISGRYQYRTTHRPKYAKPLWFGGSLSVNGSTPSVEWNLAYNHGAGRGAGGGPGIISDANDVITDRRDVRLQFTGEFPRLSANLKWQGPNEMIANFNAQYTRNYQDNSNDEYRFPLGEAPQFRDFDFRGRGRGYEVGGDFEFRLGAGKLKLIALDRYNKNNNSSDSALIFFDGSPTTGSRFANQNDNREIIGRTEYRWDMLGGNWEVDFEAAFNQFDQASQFFNRNGAGTLAPSNLANSAGEVTEDRYEMIVTHGRTLLPGLTLQLAAGMENSTLSQSGPQGLTREFWRPKGSLSLAWTPHDGLDFSLNIARRVGQLSFNQFLANVDLVLGNANAGNAELKPTMSWETTLQVKQSFGMWGSTTVQLYNKHHDDYIDVIPLPGGGESQGNIDSANVHGIEWTSTVNFDPAGAQGLRLDLKLTAEKSRIEDPLTGMERPFSNHYNRRADLTLRHDIPGTNWAWGVGAQYNHVLPAYRLSQVEVNYEGPTYTRAFIEHKDLFGLTANLNVFNMTDGRAIYRRTVYSGLRTDGNVLFHENRDLSVQPIITLQVTGNF